MNTGSVVGRDSAGVDALQLCGDVGQSFLAGIGGVDGSCR